VWELRNNPIWTYNFRAPIMDVESKQVERVFIKLLKRVQPDICHFHDMLNLTGGMIKVTKELGVKSVVTHHNYWFLCPNTYLFYNNKDVCPDPLSGQLCSECGKEFKPILRNIRERSLVERIKANLKDVLPEKIIIYLKERHQPHNNGSYSYDNYSNRDLLNLVSNRLSEFALRASKNIQILNEFVDVNLAVSMEVRDILVKYGILNERILVNHIGVGVTDFVKRKQYDGRIVDSRCLTLGYMGPLISQKGALKVSKRWQNLVILILDC
jgi:hypothetical protein